ncbi:MAG: hypothetical protein IJV37_00105 [Bacteroidales bacterium]|nr:hypothetical protein [Bacteroidales bacterium]
MIPVRQVLRGLAPMACPVRGRSLLSVCIGLVRIAASVYLLLFRLYSRYHGSKTLLFISHREAVSARADCILRI